MKRSRIDRPATWGGVAYSHNKAVRPSFSFAWKIARAKAPHTAGENLVKPAAVEIARIISGVVVANKLAMAPFIKPHHQVAYSRTLRLYFATNYCFCET